MKLSNIKAGKVFFNKWKGTTFRKVVNVFASTENYPKGEFIFFSQKPGTKLVEYFQDGKTYICPLKNFSSWAGQEYEPKYGYKYKSFKK